LDEGQEANEHKNCFALLSFELMPWHNGGHFLGFDPVVEGQLCGGLVQIWEGDDEQSRIEVNGVFFV